jgi:hypothetical protein
MEQPKGSKKGTPSNKNKTVEMETRRIKALYYILNRGIPASKDELSYQQARQKFISLFPEFMEAAPEKFNPIIMNSEREKIRDIIRILPREKKIWEEELELQIQESVNLAHQALNRNMKEVLGEEFPRPFSNKLIKAHKKLEKRLAELKTSSGRSEEYERSEMEVIYAWDIIRLIALWRVNDPDEPLGYIERLCLFNQIGKACGLLMTLSKTHADILKDSYFRCNQKYVAQKTRSDPLQSLIIKIISNDPQITATELLDELSKHEGGGIVEEITDDKIYFYGKDKKGGNSAKITGLKDRMTRARKIINKKAYR